MILIEFKAAEKPNAFYISLLVARLCAAVVMSSLSDFSVPNNSRNAHTLPICYDMKSIEYVMEQERFQHKNVET